MWKILELLRRVALLAEELSRFQNDLGKLQSELKDTRKETHDLARTVERLSLRLDSLEKNTAKGFTEIEKDLEQWKKNFEEKQERDSKIRILELENFALRFRQGLLPPAKPEDAETPKPEDS